MKKKENINLQSFEYYLKDEGLRESTIREHVKNLERFMPWANENGIPEISHLTYTELLSYVQHLKKQSLSTHTVNIRINSIRKYYEHLKQEGYIEINPAKRLFIKGATKKIIHNPLSYAELEELYTHYTQYIEQKPVREKKQRQSNLRNKVVLGLMLWQGVHSGELDKMETQNVNLKNGTIYIPGAARGQSRELKLETAQIIPLHEYLNIRQKQIGDGGGAKLFHAGMHNVVQYLTEELKGINPVIKNAQHLRASVILHWLKMYGKRQVQYMIGHKWISSTENYEIQELTGLTDLLQKHHPFS